MICPRSAILHSAAASIVEGTLRVDRFHRREDRHLRLTMRPSAWARSMAFWTMSTLSSSVGQMLTAASVMMSGWSRGWHVHDEAVADAPVGAQPRVALHHGAHQLVGVEAALHQRLGPPFTPSRRPWRPRAAVRDVNTLITARCPTGTPARLPAIFACRTDQDGPDEPHLLPP